jgi:glycosyltransferase involved in cell wall biosynthesis
MKILQVNKFLHPKGGADKYCLILIEELEKMGVTVATFGMADERNIESKWQKYFSENIDYYKSGNYLKIARRFIWNKEAAKKFAAILDDFKPDLIHAHNIYHQLSPSILFEAKKRNIPIILTLHDYKLICPNYLMFSKGKHCEKCLKGSYLNCLINNCYNSYPRSALATLESFLHNKVWRSYQKNIDLFISPSNYLKEKMIQAGWNADKITVLINPAPDYKFNPIGQNLLYIGRLSKEKGVDILLKALKGTSEKLDIAGTGPEEDNLKELCQQLNLNERVVFHGQVLGQALEDLRSKAKAVILPSVWAENMSLVLLESLANGKIVIASNTGGTPELIEEGKTGFLFTAGDIKMLTEKINKLAILSDNEKELMFNYIKEKIIPLNLKEHLEKLQKLYQQFQK